MRRHLMATALCTTSLVLGLSGTSAKEKGQKPVQERFEATMNPSVSDDRSLSLAIEEFSSDAEVEDLKRSFAQGGEEALWRTLHRMKKGYFTMGSGQTMPIRVLQSSSAGGSRRLNIIGEAPTLFRGVSGSVSIGHRGYPYTWIQLAVDEQGNGKGTLIPFANIVFNKEGRMEIVSMKSGSIQLLSVHLEK
jgi:hypothetical protein